MSKKMQEYVRTMSLPVAIAAALLGTTTAPLPLGLTASALVWASLAGLAAHLLLSYPRDGAA